MSTPLHSPIIPAPLPFSRFTSKAMHTSAGSSLRSQGSRYCYIQKGMLCHRTSRSESTPNISAISSAVKVMMVLTGLKACRTHDAAAIFSSLTRIKTPVQGGGSCLLDRPRVNTGSPSESPQAQRPYVLAQPSLKLFLSNRISSQIANLLHRRYCANAQRLRVAAIEALGRLKRGRWGGA